LFTSVLFIALGSYAQNGADAANGVWFDEEKTAKFEIYEQSGKYFAKIIWLDEPIDPDTGKPKLDKENPEEDLQSRPLMGLVFMKDFEFEGDGLWEDGEIYDPKSGKTYSCYMKLEEPDKLKVRGYIGFSVIGRTSYWTKAE
jgi:uncharacterized protein (DUF2147 family)